MTKNDLKMTDDAFIIITQMPPTEQVLINATATGT